MSTLAIAPTYAPGLFRRVMRDRLLLALTIGTFALMLLTSVFLVMGGFRTQAIWADGEGYYFYLPSAFIYHDMTMAWTDQLTGNDLTAIRPIAPGVHGGYLNAYPMGVAIIELPAFLVAHAFALLTGSPATGLTTPYQLGVLFTAAVVAALGAAFLFKALERYVSRRIAACTVLTLLLGTNLYDYATEDGSFSHVYTFCLLAGLILLVPRWYYGGLRWGPTIGIGALLGLLVLVRNTNALFLLVVLLWGIARWQDVPDRLRLFWRRRWPLLVGIGTAIAVFFPQLLYWHYVAGSWIVNSYQGAYAFDPAYQGHAFDFLHPQILQVLFDPATHGVFVWAPVLALAVAGLFFVRKHLREWAVVLYAVPALFLYIIAAWFDPAYGYTYGHRGFIDIYPLLALPIAILYQRLSPRLLPVIGVLVGICILANLWLTWGYIRGILSGVGITWQLYADTWHRLLAELRGPSFEDGFLGVLALVAISFAPLAYFLVTERRAPLVKEPSPR